MNKILKPHKRTMLAIARKFNCYVTKSKHDKSYCLLHNAIPCAEDGYWFGSMISRIPSFLVSDFDSHNWEIPVSANKKGNSKEYNAKEIAVYFNCCLLRNGARIYPFYDGNEIVYKDGHYRTEKNEYFNLNVFNDINYIPALACIYSQDYVIKFSYEEEMEINAFNDKIKDITIQFYEEHKGARK